MCTKSELQEIIDRVREESVHIYGKMLDKIILYGSYARGDNTDESDIDIMIILDCGAKEVRSLRDATSEMSSNISLEKDAFLSILLRDKDNFNKNSDFLPFYQNILREGVVVYG